MRQVVNHFFGGDAIRFNQARYATRLENDCLILSYVKSSTTSVAHEPTSHWEHLATLFAHIAYRSEIQPTKYLQLPNHLLGDGFNPIAVAFMQKGQITGPLCHHRVADMWNWMARVNISDWLDYTAYMRSDLSPKQFTSALKS